VSLTSRWGVWAMAAGAVLGGLTLAMSTRADAATPWSDPGSVVAHPDERGADRAAGLGLRPADGSRADSRGPDDRGARRSPRTAAAEGGAGAAGRLGGRRGALDAVGRCAGRGCCRRHRARVPDARSGDLPRPAGGTARRAGQGRGPALRGRAGGPLPLRRHRVRARAGRGARRRLPTRCRRPRHRRLVGRSGFAIVRPDRGRRAGARVLRTHDAVLVGHRPALAALGSRAICCIATWWRARWGKPTYR
jgi:hypothetical protein